MRIEFEGDYPVNAGTFIPGEEVPGSLAALPVARLRLMDGKVIDAARLAAFYVDPHGRKHVVGRRGWVLVQCMWDDELVRDGEGWRVASAADRAAGAAAVAWEHVRRQRGRLLAESDWTQMPDTRLTVAERAAWATYRQALREVPQNFAVPDQVVWPKAPE